MNEKELTRVEELKCAIEIPVREYLKYIGWIDVGFDHYRKSFKDESGNEVNFTLPPILAFCEEMRRHGWVGKEILQKYMEAK